MFQYIRAQLTQRAESAADRVTGAQTAPDAAKSRAARATADTALYAARQSVLDCAAAATSLDGEQARITADPADDAVLRAEADHQLAEVEALRHQRHDAWTQRASLTTQRDAAYAAYDARADDLDTTAGAMDQWASRTSYPTLAQVAAALHTVAADSVAHRQRTPGSRTDDPSAAATTLSAQLATLRTALGSATAERDLRLDALRTASDAAASVNADAPTG